MNYSLNYSVNPFIKTNSAVKFVTSTEEPIEIRKGKELYNHIKIILTLRHQWATISRQNKH